MITKQQLEEVWKEIEYLSEIWKKDRKENRGTKYTVSHRLLGLFLTNFDDKRELKTK